MKRTFEMSNDNKSGKENQLKEGVDYYLENSLIVFTSHYHLKRGYCCGSGCRHCPYKNESGEQSTKSVKT